MRALRHSDRLESAAPPSPASADFEFGDAVARWLAENPTECIKYLEAHRLLPKRQVICGNCGATLFADESPDGEIPPYCCPGCRSSWPPTEEELKSRAQYYAECTRRANQRRRKARYRDARGRRANWVRTPKRAQRKRLGDSISKEKTRVEELFDKPLSKWTRRERYWYKNFRAKKLCEILSPAIGRPPESVYDTIHRKRELAQALGVKVPSIKELARQEGILQSDELDQIPQTRKQWEELQGNLDRNSAALAAATKAVSRRGLNDKKRKFGNKKP